MLTVNLLLDKARERIEPSSDYRLAKVLGVSQPTVISWRKHRSHPAPLAMARLARLADVCESSALLWLQVERATTPAERELWQSIALQFEASKRPQPRAPTRQIVAVDNAAVRV